ncbi:MAG: Ubiquinone/menaquinone biosynthesis C-methyltransferase UbiE [Verrucomicrobiae bacterium]|nr:Ubiquinone/menaquinone biosynthesis C-methyltransferase UbiE [Verrucomicrobiae bacterium]
MDDAEYHQLAAVEDRHWWCVGMADIAADWLQRWTGGPPARLLDAGCGTGGARRWLGAFGAVHSLDRHPLALEYASRSDRHRLVSGDVSALPFAADSFAIVTSFDVLYHRNVTDDWTALREFARVLQPGGWLLVRVPAYNWLRGAHDRAVQTRHRYSRRELRTKLEALGFRPVRTSYVNSVLFLPSLLWRLVQVRRPAESELRLPPAPINAALQAILALERWWLRRGDLPVGLSVLALAQKECR